MAEQALGTTTITQVGVIVADIEAKSKAWADVLGLPVPEIIITDAYEISQTEYQGQPQWPRRNWPFSTWDRWI